jgi:hypothetical protein
MYHTNLSRKISDHFDFPQPSIKIGLSFLIVAILYLMTSCSAGGPPDEAKSAIQQELQNLNRPQVGIEISYDPNWKVDSSQKASNLPNGGDEAWCIVINPPLIVTTLGSVTATYKNFIVQREGLLWRVFNRGAGKDTFLRYGCSNFPSN